jgi:hypothetical protein
VHELDELKGKCRSRRTSRERIAEQVQAVFEKYRCAALFDWKLTSESVTTLTNRNPDPSVFGILTPFGFITSA